MKLLILAQIPPPLHGQSVMVKSLVEGLPSHGIPLRHVNLRISHDVADIGRWRLGKIFAILGACLRAIDARFCDGCDTLYYVPAPAKRGALYRDWLVMLLCRPFYSRLVLHWHAAGLGKWLMNHVTAPERVLTRLLLGRADLSIILSKNLRDDAEALSARRIVVVPNGIADPCPGFARVEVTREWREAVFLGLGVREKGLLDAAEAVVRANQNGIGPRWRLSAAGDLVDASVAAAFAALAAHSEGAVRHVGFVTDQAKHALLAGADTLIFPTRYEAETQGLVVVEALAYDLPVIVTRWRAVAENLPADVSFVVAPGAVDEIAAALARIGRMNISPGVARRHFLAQGTREQFLARIAAAFGQLDATSDA